MSLHITHRLDMSWGELGAFLDEMALAISTLYDSCDDEEDSIDIYPLWYLYLSRFEPLTDDPNYTTVPLDQTDKMATDLEIWISNPDFLWRFHRAGVSMGWLTLVMTFIESHKKTPECFCYG